MKAAANPFGLHELYAVRTRLPLGLTEAGDALTVGTVGRWKIKAGLYLLKPWVEGCAALQFAHCVILNGPHFTFALPLCYA